ncbi:MAG: hypothetical protein JWM98_1523 [Thermoleophilia bacterium]|nr:hypothetical protein [Thermoleophilia bacterium]
MSVTKRARYGIRAVLALSAAAVIAAGCGDDGSSKGASTTRSGDAKMAATSAAMKDGATKGGAMKGDAAAGGEKVLASTVEFDAAKGTATLPVHRGTGPDGKATYYIVTESSDEADAKARGVNFAPRLANALGTKAIQHATGKDGALRFAASVDFTPRRVVKPGTQGFPPVTAVAGAHAGAGYSPLVETGTGVVLNAPQVANATGMNDSVLSLDPKQGTVTLAAFTGFGDGRSILYIRTEGSVELLAAIEGTTLDASLNSLPGLATEGPASPRQAIVPIVNGARTGADRQGLESALLGGGSPLNVVQSLPGNPAYSPIWDVAPAAWTPAAIKAGSRKLLTSTGAVKAAFERGDLTSGIPDGTANESLGGLRAAGFISNCSVVAVLDA